MLFRRFSSTPTGFEPNSNKFFCSTPNVTSYTCLPLYVDLRGLEKNSIFLPNPTLSDISLEKRKTKLKNLIVDHLKNEMSGKES